MLLNNFTLLYAEDDIDTQEALSNILEDEVKELYLAKNGEEALNLYKEHQPDIVLTDINMPIIDGIEMSKKIKEINHYTPIIVLTAFDDINNLKKTIDIGVDKYIIKPIIDFEVFFDTLESIAKILQTEIDKKNMEMFIQSQSKITAMGEMLGNIAHQWRQPLNVISSMSSALKLKIMIGEEIKNEEILESTEKILKQTNYLSNTIDDFRSFLTEEESLRSRFYIKDTFNYLESLINDSYKNNFITLKTDIKDVILFQNENHLIQALLNILNNAKDAFLSNNINYDRFVFVKTHIEDEKLLIAIKDNAGGISEAIINQIFEPYFTTKHQSTGTGIGLFISNKIITKNYEGKIEVKNCTYKYNNVEYKGAEFLITLNIN